MKRNLLLLITLGFFLVSFPRTESMEDLEKRPIVNRPSGFQKALSLSMIPEPVEPDIFSPDRVTGQATDLQIALQLSRDTYYAEEAARGEAADIEAALEASRIEEARRKAADLVAESHFAQDAQDQIQRAKAERTKEQARLVAEINELHPILTSLWVTYMKAIAQHLESISAYSKMSTVDNKGRMEDAARIKNGIQSRVEPALSKEDDLVRQYFAKSSTRENTKKKTGEKYDLARRVLDQVSTIQSLKGALQGMEKELSEKREAWVAAYKENKNDDPKDPGTLRFKAAQASLSEISRTTSLLSEEIKRATEEKLKLVGTFFNLIAKQ